MTGRRIVVPAVVAGLATAIVCIAIVISSSGGDDGASKPPAHDVTAVLRGIPQQGLILGHPRAPVLLVEFADPQCPFCKEFASTTWPDIVRRYVRTGKVRMELRLMGFLGPDSVKAGKALLAASLQNRMWEASARFYALQREENSGYVTDPFLRRVLGGVRDLDVRRAMRDRADARVKQELGAVNSMSSRYGVHSTPTLLVGTSDGDLRVVAHQTPSPEQLGATLDAELAKHR